MRMLLAALIVTLSLAALPVKAAIVHVSFDFSASDFGPAPPVHTVTGSFSSTFDNSAAIPDTTAGVTAATINIPVASAIGFTYDPFLDQLIIGGLQNSVALVAPGTADFFLVVDGVSTNPTFDFLVYALRDRSRFGSSFGTITPASVVPEPASLALLTGGIGLLSLIRWRGNRPTPGHLRVCSTPGYLQTDRWSLAPTPGPPLFQQNSDEEKGTGKKIDVAALKPVVGTLYPPPFDEPCRARERTRLGDAAGLTPIWRL